MATLSRAGVDPHERRLLGASGNNRRRLCSAVLIDEDLVGPPNPDRQANVDTTLAQQTVDPTLSPGIWGNAIRWKLSASARGDQLHCVLPEQPQPAGRTFRVSARDSVMPLGLAGIFQSGLGGIRHDNFQITRVTAPPWTRPS